MNCFFALRRVAWIPAAAVLLSACHKQNPVEDLEKAAATLDKAEKAPAAPDAPDAPPPAAILKEAISDYKTGKMEDAVTRLQLLRAQSTLSPQQRMAVQDSIASVMTEIYALAEKGDARAAAAVLQYERMQTAHH